MRMWMINPVLLCRKHLLGEHNEIHKHKHNFEKKHSITGRIKGNACEPESMKIRHNILANEMLRRGYNHNSPYELPDLSYLPIKERYYIVDKEQSRKMLESRCEECKKRIREEGDLQ